MLVTITVKPLVANAVSAVFLRPENFLPLLGGQTRTHDVHTLILGEHITGERAI
jgi:hypothetical protein